MTDKEKAPVSAEVHRQLAAELFNHTWTLLDMAERTAAQDDEMIHAAHASRYHWGVVGTPLNAARGEWQIARVYAVLGRSEPAVYHAGRSLDICKENNYGDFDLAFAYEALARGYAVAGDKAACEAHLKLAREAGEQIAEDDDREYLEGELESIQVK